MNQPHRTRPRTFPYRNVLPYATESDPESLAHLDHIVANLYISLAGHRLRPGSGAGGASTAVHWTRELHSWMKLKFDMPMDVRLKLTKVFYGLTLAQSDGASADRFVGTLRHLWSDRTLLSQVTPAQAGLDWRPFVTALRKIVFVTSSPYDGGVKATAQALSSLAETLGPLFEPDAFIQIWHELLPQVPGPPDRVSVNLLAALAVVSPLPGAEGSQAAALSYRKLLPTVFQLWSLTPPGSLSHDVQICSILANLVSAALRDPSAELGSYGFLDRNMTSCFFSNVVKMLDLPLLAASRKQGEHRSTDSTIFPLLTHPVSSIIFKSLTPGSSGIAEQFATFMSAVESFCHPSNTGPWTAHILGLVQELVLGMAHRWSEQLRDESFVPKDRWLTQEILDNFVNAVLNSVFFGVHAKSRPLSGLAHGSLPGLAFLSPDIVIPRLLKEVYPSLQGLTNEPHRVVTSLAALNHVAGIIAKSPKYAIHIAPLLELALPCVDANDPSKTIFALSFIQSCAFSVPFVDISADNRGLSMEYIPAAINELMEGRMYDYDNELALSIVKSSSYAFNDLVISFLSRVFLTLENMPERSQSTRHSPENAVLHTLPNTVTAVLSSVSDELFDQMLSKTIEFVTSNVIHNAADTFALICGSFVRIRPSAFKKFFPILFNNIKYEVEENGAGMSRTSVPRDRSLIWYLSILNMVLAGAGASILPHKEQVLELTLFLHNNTRGQIVYHTTNSVHHAIVGMVSIYPNDFKFTKTGTEVNVEHWGYQPDPKNLDLVWHNPTREEVEFAVELYSKHVTLSMSKIEEMTTSKGDRQPASVTEFSDVVSNNLTFIRTATSAVALLVDSNRGRPQADAGDLLENDPNDDIQTETVNSDASKSDGGFDYSYEAFVVPGADADMGDDSDEWSFSELQRFRTYPTNYFFSSDTKHQDELYIQIHDLRNQVGVALHQVHQFLISGPYENDTSSFKELLFAMKVWFSDVGYERSSKIESHQRALYNYEATIFKLLGGRKMFPRAVLARRAFLYHLQRLLHNAGPREMTTLERTLLFDLSESALSIYPDIRRNAESSLYSSCKVLVHSRAEIYPFLLKELIKSIHAQDYKRTEAGLKFFGYRNVPAMIKRDRKRIIEFVDLISEAVSADNENLNGVALTVFNAVAPAAFQLPTFNQHVDLTDIEPIRPAKFTESMQERVTNLQNQQHSRRLEGQTELFKLMDRISEAPVKDLHWRLVLVQFTIMSALLPSPQMPVHAAALNKLCEGVLSSHPNIKKVAQETFVLSVYKLYLRATTNYNNDIYRIDYDEPAMRKDCANVLTLKTDSNFTNSFLAELENVQSPKYFVDQFISNPLHVDVKQSYDGWLAWSGEKTVNKVDGSVAFKLNDEDDAQLKVFSKTISKEWVSALFQRQRLEPRPEDDHFEIIVGMCFKAVLALVDWGYADVTFTDIGTLARERMDYEDKNWHKCQAELSFALIHGQLIFKEENRKKALALAEENWLGLTNSSSVAHENIGYWKSFLRWSFDVVDHRRIWPVIKTLNEFRISETSGFKDSFKLSLHTEIYSVYSWTYRHGRDEVTANLVENIGHNLQRIRDEVSRQLSVIVQSASPNPGFSDLKALVESNYKLFEDGTTSLGALPFKLSDKHRESLERAFDLLEQRRLERESFAGSVSESPYTLTAKTICTFLVHILGSSFGVALAPLIGSHIMPALLALSSIRDDPEIVSLLTKVYGRLASLSYTASAIDDIITLLETSVVRASWHQKLRILLFVQIFYFNNFFRLNKSYTDRVIEFTLRALDDPQLEVRDLAATTLSGIVRCLPSAEQQILITDLLARFRKTVVSSKNTKQDASKILRHGAVLGYGALVNAFPYTVPPPVWVPSALATLAVHASGDGGAVGKSVKQILSDFKRTRQDTWHIDQTVFTQDQLDDLEGVLWKNYFV